MSTKKTASKNRAKSANRSSRIFKLEDSKRLRDLCGPGHHNLQVLELHLADFDLKVESQGGEIRIDGEGQGPKLAEQALTAFADRVEAGADPSGFELEGVIRLVRDDALPTASGGGEIIAGLNKPVTPQTPGQRTYLKTLRDDASGLVFGTGPAGTGKTFLAVAVGAAELKTGKRERLIVARPAVEAGEQLGFLPGALEEKVDPYMLPIWDALNELLGAQEVERRKARKEIEVAPLAFMRGRTLKNAFVIIDEAQNATIPQMKMVLTRLGRGSRMVVTGDPSQTDLPDRSPSGLAHGMRILEGVEGVAQTALTAKDVVRHDLVARIVTAYDDDENGRNA
ncbi:PhoH family protein [Hirschia baltica]|uniref:PhoH-like protein n=1 Tax=Hirschia baltica (strain ATCC 49814 / DSM 5838 / IFAM 1418) TaxID=582402 RepID=C6XIE7_HIRBI|nr:PhoH family protein [Hirschia baltica]ACT60754.1 PhoH family protein [Hirschia baltica ATCC 49814]